MKKKKGQGLMNSLKASYFELLEIIKEEDFKTFGFSVAGKHHAFIKKVEALSHHKDNHAVFKLLKVNGSMLLHMAYSYSVSKGLNTDVINNIEIKFKRAFK